MIFDERTPAPFLCPALYTTILTHTPNVKDDIYRMDFTTACDRLTDCPTHDDIARQADCSVQTVRQARMDPAAPGYRSPPVGWEQAIAVLALERSVEPLRLAEELRGVR